MKFFSPPPESAFVRRVLKRSKGKKLRPPQNWLNFLTCIKLSHKLSSYQNLSLRTFHSMKKQREINPEAFERMLLWLDKDRDIAGQKYEAMRLRLIKIFDYRRCLNSEELADITFDRVLKKIEENAVSNDAAPAAYFCRVA